MTTSHSDPVYGYDPRTDLAAAVDTLDEELRSWTHGIWAISQMCRSNGEGAIADQIAGIAEDLEAVAWVVGDLPVVLLVLGVAKEHNSDDLVAYRSAAITDSCCGECGTLAVVCVSDVIDECLDCNIPIASRHNLGTGTLAVGKVEESPHLSDGSRASTIREEVIRE